MKLQPSSPNYIYARFVGMGFQMKEILEQIEVGLNPQESFAKMNEDNGVRGQMWRMELGVK